MDPVEKAKPALETLLKAAKVTPLSYAGVIVHLEALESLLDGTKPLKEWDQLKQPMVPIEELFLKVKRGPTLPPDLRPLRITESSVWPLRDAVEELKDVPPEQIREMIKKQTSLTDSLRRTLAVMNESQIGRVVTALSKARAHAANLHDVASKEPECWLPVRSQIEQLYQILAFRKEQISLSTVAEYLWAVANHINEFGINSAGAHPDDSVFKFKGVTRELFDLCEKVSAATSQAEIWLQYRKEFPPERTLGSENIGSRGAEAEGEFRHGVFLAHGRHKLYQDVATFLTDDGFDVYTFERIKKKTTEVIQTLKKAKELCGFAVIVATAEDISEEGWRARQNVVHETGLFQGKLGFERVCILRQVDAAAYSNLSGLLELPFEGQDWEKHKHELIERIENAGIERVR